MEETNEARVEANGLEAGGRSVGVRGKSKAAKERGEETKRRAPRIRRGRGKGVSDKTWSRQGMHVVPIRDEIKTQGV